MPASLRYVFVQQWKPWYILLPVVVELGFTPYLLLRSVGFNSMRDRIDQNINRGYRLNRCGYLAIKSDETGVVGIACQQHYAGREWIFNNHPYPFRSKISVVRRAEPTICDYWESASTIVEHPYLWEIVALWLLIKHVPVAGSYSTCSTFSCHTSQHAMKNPSTS